jgi:MFS transporter, DHA2 family, multidrug resistance protein
MGSSAPFPARGRGGVGMNTVASPGALGVAVIGSLVGSLDANDLSDSLAPLPTAAQDAAQESIGAAGALAARLPPEAGHALLSAVGDPFVGAMGMGLPAGAALRSPPRSWWRGSCPGRAGQGTSDTRAVGRAERRMGAERGAVL